MGSCSCFESPCEKVPYELSIVPLEEPLYLTLLAAEPFGLMP